MFIFLGLIVHDECTVKPSYYPVTYIRQACIHFQIKIHSILATAFKFKFWWTFQLEITYLYRLLINSCYSNYYLSCIMLWYYGQTSSLWDRAMKYSCWYSKDRVKHDSFRVFNAFVTRFSCVCMKRVLKRVDSRFSRYKRVSQQPIKSALQKREKNAFGPDFAQKISTNQKHLFAFANDVENAKIVNPS